MRSVRAKTPASVARSVRKASFAIFTGRDIGTETTCAPMISFSFQPKPLFGP